MKTYLIAAVPLRDLAQATGLARTAFAEGADLVELRADAIGDADTVSALLRTLGPERCVVTCRPVDEGGASKLPMVDRVELLCAARAAGAALIDFEFAGWSGDQQARARIATAAGSAVNQAAKPSLILSGHRFDNMAMAAERMLGKMASAAPQSVAKVAWMPQDITDNFTALDAIRQSDRPSIVICMGEVGLLSRVLARKVGAFASYCSAGLGQETAPGQIDVDQMRRLYRWDVIDADTRLFGVLGDPVGHSRSPWLFNTVFADQGINAVYVPLRVTGGAAELARFLDGCRARSWLGAGGFSVTLPLKEAALGYVGSAADPPARRIGAVNTLVTTEEGFAGYNTDYLGALDALTRTLEGEGRRLAGSRTTVLGAGGVARAVVAALRDAGSEVEVYNRTPSRARTLANEFGCTAREWDTRASAGGDVLINCTSVGMWPDVSQSPMPAEALNRWNAVFDTVYNPPQTRLLREAKSNRCLTISGLDMFVVQAAAQFKLWTGRTVDGSAMRAALRSTP